MVTKGGNSTVAAVVTGRAPLVTGRPAPAFSRANRAWRAPCDGATRRHETTMRTTLLLPSLPAATLFGCGGGRAKVPGGQRPPPASVSRVPPAPDPGCVGSSCQYDGNGFVVHEWGTNTFVVGSDGVPLRGLQHEEEDLPA